MGVLDKIFGTGGESEKEKADFSDVRSGSSSTAPSPQSQRAPGRTYTVVAGDSLSKIAKREYGDASKWPAIYEANRDQIKNPDLIHPGQVLTLPREG
jgi:nucleoid-associated protein YgaU